MTEVTRLTDILDELEKGMDNGSISVKDFVANFESRGFGPLILAPALVTLLPTGAIPGVPSICGVIISFVVVQMLLGKKHPWLPGFIRDREISQDSAESIIGKAKKWTRKIDRFIGPRLTFLVETPFQYVVAVISVLLGLSMIPLELIPFAAAVPAFALIMISLGLSARDGLLVLIGYLSIFAGAFFIYRYLY